MLLCDVKRFGGQIPWIYMAYRWLSAQAVCLVPSPHKEIGTCLEGGSSWICVCVCVCVFSCTCKILSTKIFILLAQ